MVEEEEEEEEEAIGIGGSFWFYGGGGRGEYEEGTGCFWTSTKETRLDTTAKRKRAREGGRQRGQCPGLRVTVPAATSGSPWH